MLLRELIKEIRGLKHWTQVQMAHEMKLSQQNIQGMENAGTNQEKLWAIFVKLLPLCAELNLDPVRKLCDDRVAQMEKELQEDVEQETDKQTRRSIRHTTQSHKAPHARHFPPSRFTGKKSR